MDDSNLLDRQFRLTAEWFSLGIVDAEKLAQMRGDWAESGDHNPEHYRYRAFRSYLKANRPVTPSIASDLFSLGAADEDSSMGGSMMADIVRLEECPQGVLDAAEETGSPFLVRLVRQRRGDPS